MTRHYIRGTPSERFWAKVIKGPACWLWTASLTSAGYGSFWVEGQRRQGAHLFAYEETRGSIPAGLELDHLCRNPRCVNPAHLEAVTHVENVRRGSIAQKTHCKHGHPFDEFNTRRSYDRFGRPRRDCRMCIRVRQGYAGGLRPERRMTCPRGHRYDEANTYVTGRGSRECRTCKTLRNRRPRGGAAIAGAAS